MGYIKDFCNNNCSIFTVIGAIIAFFSGVLAVIFHCRTVRKRKNNVIGNVSIEFLNKFIINFFELKDEIMPIWNGMDGNEMVEDVLKILEKYPLQSKFVHWESDPDEITYDLQNFYHIRNWNNKNKNKNVLSVLQGFVSMAEVYTKNYEIMKSTMVSYMSEEQKRPSHIPASLGSHGRAGTLRHFSYKHFNNENTVYNNGKVLTENMEKYIKKLPKKLKLAEYWDEIRGLDNPLKNNCYIE